MPVAIDTLKTKRTLEHDGVLYEYSSLPVAARHIGDISRLPFSLKVVLENLLRHEDGGQTVAVRDIGEFSAWLEHRCSRREVAFRRALVLMPDFTGVPAELDRINPLSPLDLVIDHSASEDVYGTNDAFDTEHGIRVPTQLRTIAARLRFALGAQRWTALRPKAPRCSKADPGGAP